MQYCILSLASFYSILSTDTVFLIRSQCQHCASAAGFFRVTPHEMSWHRGDVFYVGDNSDVEATALDVSFQLDLGDVSDKSSMTELTELDLWYSLPCGQQASYPQGSIQELSNSDLLLDYSDDPDDNTDKDLREIPLNYRQLKKIKTQRVQIEQHWHKWGTWQIFRIYKYAQCWLLLRYCCTKTTETGALSKWKNAEIALHQATPDNIHQFLNYCLKLKHGKEGQ